MGSSPVSQVGGVGGNEYALNSRGDRPRISLLPPASGAPTTQLTIGPEYMISPRNNNPRNLMPMQQTPDQYTSKAVEMATLQDAPPFKKIRLGQPQSQLMAQTIPAADPCIKQDHVQLPQPLRIDTRVRCCLYSFFFFFYLTNVL